MPKPMTEEEFKEKVGHYPIEDDLERVNCPKTGNTGHQHLGHQHCGWCDICDKPMSMCSCDSS